MHPNTDKKCIITGSRGYVGSRIAAYLQSQGWHIIELRRDLQEPLEKDGRTLLPWSLGNDLDCDALAGAQALIHCAWDMSATGLEEGRRVNIEPSKSLILQASNLAIRQMMFISSMSAFTGCKSRYGQAKLEVEQFIKQQNLPVAIVRPGLVYGDRPGGVMGSLNKLLSIPLLTPLVGRGDQIQYLVHEQDLARLVAATFELEGDLAQLPVLTAANQQGRTLRQILQKIANDRAQKPLFVPVPPILILWVLKLAETIGLNTGLRSDSLLSLMNQAEKPDFAASTEIYADFRSFD
jgi:nucleoside-diphosphate-sugar epimerase